MIGCLLDRVSDLFGRGIHSNGEGVRVRGVWCVRAGLVRAQFMTEIPMIPGRASQYCLVYYVCAYRSLLCEYIPGYQVYLVSINNTALVDTKVRNHSVRTHKKYQVQRTEYIHQFTSALLVLARLPRLLCIVYDATGVPAYYNN